MVIFYNKRTGSIKAVFSGNLQTIEQAYREESQDYALILGEITLDDDSMVFAAPNNFKVNIETKELELLSPISYSVANS
jgi:hypothetical protein